MATGDWSKEEARETVTAVEAAERAAPESKDVVTIALSGPQGSGKTSIIDTITPVLAAAGWTVTQHSIEVHTLQCKKS